MNETGEVLIAGAGIMGHGIAVCFARAGWQVILSDPSAEALEQARRTRRRAERLRTRQVVLEILPDLGPRDLRAIASAAAKLQDRPVE